MLKADWYRRTFVEMDGLLQTWNKTDCYRRTFFVGGGVQPTTDGLPQTWKNTDCYRRMFVHIDGLPQTDSHRRTATGRLSQTDCYRRTATDVEKRGLLYTDVCSH